MRTKEVVIKIIMIAVIIMTYKTRKMIDWKRKKRWWEQETGQLNAPKKIFIQSYKHYNEKNLKQ